MFAPYAVGSKVYRGGSSAPTQGTVDPMGYIERGIKQRMLLPSQSRSGLAAAALRRQSGMPTNTGIRPISQSFASPGGGGSLLSTGHITPEGLSTLYNQGQDVNAEFSDFNRKALADPTRLAAIRRTSPNFNPNSKVPGLEALGMARKVTSGQGLPTKLTDLANEAAISGTPYRVFNQGYRDMTSGNPTGVAAGFQNNMPASYGLLSTLLMRAAQRKLKARPANAITG